MRPRSPPKVYHLMIFMIEPLDSHLLATKPESDLIPFVTLDAFVFVPRCASIRDSLLIYPVSVSVSYTYRGHCRLHSIHIADMSLSASTTKDS